MYLGTTVHHNLSIKDPEMPLSNPIYDMSTVMESVLAISRANGNDPTCASKRGNGFSKYPHDYERAVSTRTAAKASLQAGKPERIASKAQPPPKPVCSSSDDNSVEYEYISRDGKELLTNTPSKCK